jgi:hypothetical protein
VSDTPSSDKSPPSHAPQMIGSLVVAVLIVIVTIAFVTAKLGPAAELRENDERNEIATIAAAGTASTQVQSGGGWPPTKWSFSGPRDGF